MSAAATGNRPKAVLFDLDGTLADSLPDIAGALNDLLAERGWGQFTPEQVRGMIGGGMPKLIERSLRALELTVEPEEAAALVARFRELYAPRATRLTKLFPGAMELLRILKRAGVALGVVTNKPEAVSRRMLADLSVLPLLGAVVGGDTLAEMKPDVAPVLAALDRLNCPRGGALMVGDSAADSGAARAAGIPVVLVTFGYSRVPAREIDADAYAGSFAEIPELLENFGILTPSP